MFKGHSSESDTACLCVYISDKQDSKALLGLGTLTPPELEMKGFTQIEGQSTQGSDK